MNINMKRNNFFKKHIINAYTATFDLFNASLLNKSNIFIFILLTPNSTVFP